MFAQGWYGEQHGSHICGAEFQDLQRLVGNVASELEPVNSNPQGPGVGSDTGGAFYSPAQRAGIYIFTSEYAFLSSVLTKVRLEAMNSACGTSGNVNDCPGDTVDQSLMRLALRIDDVWYISEAGQNIQSRKPDPGAWLQYEFNLDGMTFMTRSRYSDTPEEDCSGGAEDKGECSVDEFNCLPRKSDDNDVSGVPLRVSSGDEPDDRFGQTAA